MKLIIAGGRKFNREDLVPRIEKVIAELNLNVSEVVSGACGLDAIDQDRRTKIPNGADGAGETWASQRNINIRRFYAEWSCLGLKAGPLRNAEMAEYADALLLIWNGSSKGSLSMKREMLKRGKPIYEIIIT